MTAGQEHEHSDIAALEKEIDQKKEELAALRREVQREEVDNHSFVGWSADEITLDELFGDREDLIVVHNMGKRCPYCTLWADGFNGVVDHLENRAAFVVVSPDAPEQQQAFAADRGWEFDMVSDQSGEFTTQMGYRDGNTFSPGVSTFRRTDNGDIERVAHRAFGPGDDFCAAWHFFDLLADGADGWQPQFGYE